MLLLPVYQGAVAACCHFPVHIVIYVRTVFYVLSLSFSGIVMRSMRVLSGLSVDHNKCGRRLSEATLRSCCRSFELWWEAV